MRLETIANVTVIFAAFAITGVNVYDRVVSHRTGSATSVSQRFIGKPLPLPASLPTGKTGTITLFLSTNCHFCTESMGFYQRLAVATSNGACGIKLLAVGPAERETRDDMLAYLAEHHLTVDGVEMANFLNLGFSATPMIVLRNSSQLVRRIWVGRLPEAKENDVLSDIKSFCQT